MNFFLLSAVQKAPMHRSRKACTLSYPNREVLQEFNGNLQLNRKLNAAMHKNVVNVADEVLAKINILIEKVQIVLGLFPDFYHVNVVFLPDDDVARM